ncbi:MAG: GNAT family N-acetyltransferase [Bacteroidales bacterium]|jgi:N-acetylglutamate synthase-like GNAT family acetyltransferase|nr:GNAT family N-acetyltransferase [Bacteroidales bacterium]
MLCRKASDLDTLSVKRLWNDVFDDDDVYISRFIAHFGIECGYICENESEIVALAFSIPAEIHFSDSNNNQLKYIYACATQPNYRKQGVMTNLLDTVFQDACNEDYAGVFLHAADQSLTNYYRKLGFEDFFFRNHSCYYNHKEYKESAKDTNSLCSLREPLHPLRLNIISPILYQKKRVQKLNNFCFINWNDGFFRFANQTGTQFCEFENSFFAFRAVCNNIIVDELLGDISHEKAAGLLFEQFPESEVVQIRLKGDDFRCGQVKWCITLKNHDNKGWFAFAME